MTDQPIFEAQYVEKRSRLTTFFRAILAIPHIIVWYVWSLLAGLAVIVAWFALLITARYPQSALRLRRGLAALWHRGLRLSRLADRRVPAVQRRHRQLPGPHEDPAAQGGVQPPEGPVPDHLGDPGLHHRLRDADRLGDRRDHRLVRDRDHGQAAQGSAGHDRPGPLLPTAGVRLHRAADGGLAAVHRSRGRDAHERAA